MKTKVYTSFKDKYGKEYGFDNYMDFAKFWFGISYNVAKSLFPKNHKQLQFAAANSKEARKPYCKK